MTAGGGAYYYAKKSINAERQEKFERQQRFQQRNAELEYQNRISASATKPHSPPPLHDPSGSPSAEKADPAPTRHAPDSEEAKIFEKSKYEASEPFRSKKGDRFS